MLGDFHEMPFEDASFDAVYGLESMHHPWDKPRLYRKSQRVIMPGGRLLIADLFIRGTREAKRCLNRFVRRCCDIMREGFFVPDGVLGDETVQWSCENG